MMRQARSQAAVAVMIYMASTSQSTSSTNTINHLFPIITTTTTNSRNQSPRPHTNTHTHTHTHTFYRLSDSQSRNIPSDTPETTYLTFPFLDVLRYVHVFLNSHIHLLSWALCRRAGRPVQIRYTWRAAILALPPPSSLRPFSHDTKAINELQTRGMDSTLAAAERR